MQEKYGFCGCGDIRYEIDSEFLNILNCHCNMCRSHNGSSFSTYGVISQNSFEITQGEELLSKYYKNDGIKHFCSKCGTPLFSTNEKYAGLCMVFIGTLEAVEHNVPKINIWGESKLSWVDKISEILSLEKGVSSKNT